MAAGSCEGGTAAYLINNMIEGRDELMQEHVDERGDGIIGMGSCLRTLKLRECNNILT